MTLREFIETLPAPEQKLLRERLATLALHSGLTRQFAVNLNLECRLEGTTWADVASAVLQAPPDIACLVGAIRAACRGHILSGSPISAPWPLLLGRTVSKDNFERFLVKMGYRKSKRLAERFVTRLLAGSPAQVRSALKAKRLGDYVMWATFDAADGSADPFGGLPTDAAGICCRLGLDKSAKGDLLLLVYSLPGGFSPLFPTVADAGASDPWLYWFRPAVPDDRCGWTMPWDEATAPCPEAVHPPITGGTLAARVRIAKGATP